jgi:hypothetical protein
MGQILCGSSPFDAACSGQAAGGAVPGPGIPPASQGVGQGGGGQAFWADSVGGGGAPVIPSQPEGSSASWTAPEISATPDADDGGVDRETPALAVSLVVHVVILLALALAGFQERPPLQPLVRITAPVEPLEELFVEPAEVVVSDAPAEQPGAESEKMSDSVAEALAPTLSDISLVSVEVDTEFSDPIEVQPLDMVPTAAVLDANLVVQGASGVGVTGATGAVDRLTGEIAAMLEQGPTVICWVFDQSISLAGQRQEIASRLGRVFDELGMNRVGRKRPELTNIVIGFGEKVQAVTKKPTEDVDDVIEAVRSIPVDDSGAELTFQAVKAAVAESKIFRTTAPRRNVAIFVFTDEVGNDQDKVDETSTLCRTFGMPVYVVGVPAPFGMREVQFKFVDPDKSFDQEERIAQIEQGPESFYPEVVRVRSGRYQDDAMDSGFGPYALSRLCAETGGIYFCVHANRNAKGRVSNEDVAPMSSRLRYFFDAEAMRPYAPEYVSVAKLDQKIAANKAAVALVEAARQSEVSPMEFPPMTFPRQNDGALANLLGEAQNVAARVEPKINALYAILEKGSKDRDRLTVKRWQAGYDLAMGRVLAAKVRTEAYNGMLAMAKSGMKFQKPDSDTWRLERADQISVGSQTEKLAARARMYLERVVAEHPGTPWALIAADELEMPLGYKWTEDHTGVNDPKMAAGNNNNNNANTPADDKKKMLAPPKPRRDLKKL